MNNANLSAATAILKYQRSEEREEKMSSLTRSHLLAFGGMACVQ